MKETNIEVIKNTNSKLITQNKKIYRADNYNNIILMILAIYTLNIFDAVATYIGITWGVIGEGNGLMLNVVHDPSRLFWVKGVGVLVALLVMIIIYHTQKSRRHLVYQGMRFVLTVYVCLYIMHIFWLVKAFM